MLPLAPDCNSEEDVEFVLPSVSAFAAAPVATFTVVAAASAENDIVPIPERIPRVPPCELTSNTSRSTRL